MAFTEDFTAFFNPDTPGFVQTTLAGVPVGGIFDAAYELASVGGAGMATSRPVLTLATGSVPPRVADWFAYFTEPLDPLELLVTINYSTYQVVGHEPDGTGISLLLLERA
jgi:hypothetical protein